MIQRTKTQYLWRAWVYLLFLDAIPPGTRPRRGGEIQRAMTVRSNFVFDSSVSSGLRYTLAEAVRLSDLPRSCWESELIDVPPDDRCLVLRTAGLLLKSRRANRMAKRRNLSRAW